MYKGLIITIYFALCFIKICWELMSEEEVTDNLTQIVTSVFYSHICILFFVFSDDFSFQLLYKSIHIITVVCFTISFFKIYWELVSKSFKNNVGQLLWQIWLSRVTHHCHGHNRDCLLPLYTQSPSFIGPRLTRDVDIWLYMNMWTLKAA